MLTFLFLMVVIFGLTRIAKAFKGNPGTGLKLMSVVKDALGK